GRVRVAGWMLYFMLVSGLLLAAGLRLEDAARRMALPQRWIWVAGMGASTLLPLLARLRPSPSAGATAADEAGVISFLAQVTAMRLRRAIRGWEEGGDHGAGILVSEGTGPAVVGLFPGRIVLPRWALLGDPSLCRLMVAHEEEHLRARDPALLLVGAALLVVM